MTLRVLHLDHSAALSGGELALARLLRAMDPSVIASTVVCAEDGPLLERLEAPGCTALVLPLAEHVRVRSRSAPGPLAGATAIAALTAYAVRLARLARRRRINVIHTNSMKAHLYGVLAGRLARVPVVVHLHDDVNGLSPRPVARLVRRLLRHGPSAVVGCSAFVLDTARIPATGSQVVYSGVPRADVVPSGRVRSGPPTVGLVARIAPWKGQGLFLDAATRVAEARPDARFRLVGAPLFGEDAFLGRLRRTAAGPPLRDRVEFPGFVHDPQAEFDQLTVAVACSLRPEPLGQVVIEAMARGVPVVAPDEGGPTEIVTPGVDGLLVPPRDPDALADAVLTLLEDPGRASRLAERALPTVRDRFTVEGNAARLTGILQEVAR